MKKKLVWKIRDTKLDKKNFWIPFFLFWILSFLLLFLTFFFSFSNVGDIKSFQMIFIILGYSIIILSFSFPPIFFIIKRLLSNKPKKVFYFELPLLIVIYSFAYTLNQFIGIMFGGPINMTSSLFWKLIIPPIIFIIIWLVLLTISLYFYYKKKILNDNLSKNL